MTEGLSSSAEWVWSTSGRPNERERVLNSALDAVMNGRNNTYGPPHQDFKRVAGMLGALGFSVTIDGEPIEAYHVAIILACVKISRLMWSPGHSDSWDDLAGYAACGSEAYLEEGGA